MDPDIVADPEDLAYMRAEIDKYPEFVVHAQHKLWPASTGREEWVWSHGPWKDGRPEMSQVFRLAPGWCSLGFTYIPRQILDLASAQMPFWKFGQIDMGLSRMARENNIPIWLCDGIEVKHLHFNRRQGYLEWTRQS